MSPPVRPILKWAGGKRQLLPEIRCFYPDRFRTYFEPFLGSGAVFLDLYNSGSLEGRAVRLSDINGDIIGCYCAVRDSVEKVIDALRALEAGYCAGGAEFFYEIRDTRFNPQRRRLSAESPASKYGTGLAAMLIFLNRTGYNGLFRVNARGDFNVPAGDQRKPKICDEANLRRWSQALQRPGVTLAVAGFDEALADASGEDFVYLDPPYAPVSGTARFTSYTAGGFDHAAQARLQQIVLDLAWRGAHILLSNSAVPAVRHLYAANAGIRSAGLRATTVAARRAINSRASRRGPVREYLITNVARRTV
jgi:DNA adenine methylase